jgi:hypothetical protein
MLWTRIRELLGSNLGRNTGCGFRGFPLSFLANGGAVPGLRHRRFLQNPFQFINHPTVQHYTAYILTESYSPPTYSVSMALKPFLGPWPLCQFLDLLTQMVGLLGRGISPSQGRYLHTQDNTNTE